MASGGASAFAATASAIVAGARYSNRGSRIMRACSTARSCGDAPGHVAPHTAGADPARVVVGASVAPFPGRTNLDRLGPRELGDGSRAFPRLLPLRLPLERRQHPLRSHGNLVDPHPDRVVD